LPFDNVFVILSKITQRTEQKNMLIERSQKRVLTQRIESEPRQFIQVLYDPRQVGKTTLALQFMEGTKLPVHFASADLAAFGESSWISQQWETARIKLRQ